MRLTVSLLLLAAATVQALKYCCKEETPEDYQSARAHPPIHSINRPHFHCSEHSIPFLTAEELPARGESTKGRNKLLCCGDVKDDAKYWEGEFADVDCSYGAAMPAIQARPQSRSKSPLKWFKGK